MINKKLNITYYYPFCSESYWPTAYDAIEEMRKQCRFDSGIKVYQTYNEARDIAETTVFDDETWIVVEIRVIDGKASACVSPNSGNWTETEVDDYLLDYFNIQPSIN
jgi:hypothetical protein